MRQIFESKRSHLSQHAISELLRIYQKLIVFVPFVPARYIRTFEVISEVNCVFLRRKQRFKKLRCIRILTLYSKKIAFYQAAGKFSISAFNWRRKISRCITGVLFKHRPLSILNSTLKLKIELSEEHHEFLQDKTSFALASAKLNQITNNYMKNFQYSYFFNCDTVAGCRL